MKRLIILIGASGSRKSAVALLLAARPRWAGNVFHLDDIGVPTGAGWELFDSGEARQQWATAKWTDHLVARDAPLQLLDAQTRPSFVRAAAKIHPGFETTVMLLDCSADVRRRRRIDTSFMSVDRVAAAVEAIVDRAAGPGP